MAMWLVLSVCKGKIVGSNPALVEKNFRPSSYSMCSGLSIKWPGRPLVTGIGIKFPLVIPESNKTLQMHVHHTSL